MSQSAKTAIGGMSVALSVVLMLATVIGIWTYALPAIAGLLIMFCVIELNKKWAAGVFAAVSILSLILLPNKEAAVFYTCFFGCYPIIKAILESKLPRVAEYILKFAVFNVGILLAGVIMVKLFGMPMAELLGTEGEQGAWVKYALPLTIAVGNVTFLAYDFMLTFEAALYIRRWQKKFRKLFPFK
ncbi:MAG: hypothetical protein PUC33_00215 [Oscillospiraceae bacterium]|nr:hypothetical protein [Oscillospiraceae bacterium]